MKRGRGQAPWRGTADQARWRASFDELGALYNREELLPTDPVMFLHRNDDPATIERTGLLAAGLAFGGVPQIQRSVEAALSLAGHLEDPSRITSALAGLRHRWATGADIAVLLTGARVLQAHHGSLEAVFLSHDDQGSDYTAALTGLRHDLLEAGRSATGLHAGTPLMPDPAAGSAAKRWHLLLRWLIRRDEVDRGIWTSGTPGRLLMPLDTHIFRISRRLGLTDRRTPGLAAAREITALLRKLDPYDPVRWDFALTRLGMLGICAVDTPDCSSCPLQGTCLEANARNPRTNP